MIGDRGRYEENKTRKDVERGEREQVGEREVERIGGCDKS